MGTKIDYSEVARIACQAFTDNVSASARIAERLGISHKYACQLVMRARRHGFDIPKLPTIPLSSTLKPVKKLQSFPVLVCADCGNTFEVSELLQMKRHVLSEHQRTPSRSEMTPKELT